MSTSIQDKKKKHSMRTQNQKQKKWEKKTKKKYETKGDEGTTLRQKHFTLYLQFTISYISIYQIECIKSCGCGTYLIWNWFIYSLTHIEDIKINWRQQQFHLYKCIFYWNWFCCCCCSNGMENNSHHNNN